MKAAAVIIVRGFGETRPRLAAVLNVGERRALAKAMFHDVVSAAQGCKAIGNVVVITPDREVLDMASQRSLVTLREEGATGMDKAFSRGAKFCNEKGIDTMVSLPGDIPLLTPRDLSYLLGRVDRKPKSVVVPSTIGPGTSILVSSPPDAIQPRFEEDDHTAHVAEAQRLGVPVEVCELLQAGLDIDTPKDLARLFLVERPCRTRELLEDMEVLDRLRPFF